MSKRYEICFIRSNADDRHAFKTDRYLVGQEREQLITQTLRRAGIKVLPVLREWSFAAFDEGLDQYEITAHFVSCLTYAEIEELFRLALGGDLRIRELPAVFERMASMN